jgi:UDP-N-acetylmuramoylalanine--D-glutamate ligase
MNHTASPDLAGKRIIVLGLGMNGGGLGVTRFLVEQGAHVTVTDLKTAEQLAPSMEALRGLPVRYVLGEHRLEDLAGADMLVRNPAVPAESSYLVAARAAGVPIEMEMGLFFQLCPAPIMGITGTKGKTTTTLLAGAILREMDPATVVAGNLRVSALELLPQMTERTPVLLELSSWQLEGLESHHMSPQVAVVTNLSPDHLNRYPSYGAYIQAKQTIVRWQQPGDMSVLNRDDPAVAAFVGDGRADVVWFSRRQPVAGVYLDGQDIVVNWRGRSEVLARRSDIRIPGDHNVENVVAACAAAVARDIPAAAIRKGIQGFAGAEHRLEFVRSLAGVGFYNDTAATAPAAALAALQAFEQPIVLIAGGADKDLDFTELGRVIAGRVKALVLLDGSATSKLQAAVEAGGGQIAGRFGDMVRAVEQAQTIAADGDVVLLSPGCASFGLFSNEFDRGLQFKQAVQALA